MAAPYNWVPRQRDYDKERGALACQLTHTEEHPLRGTIVTNVSSKGIKDTKKQQSAKQPESSDPLSMMASQTFEGIDPLSMLLQEQTLEEKKKEPERTLSPKPDKFGDKEGYLDETFEPWNSKKSGILAKFTTLEKLSITNSSLSGSSPKKGLATKQQTTTTATDKMKTRLKQLNDFEEGSLKEMLNLSQQDYIKKIEELNQELIADWKADQRVKALKIAIQCAKLLGDISVMQFYPSKFVIITDILDNFGKLVFERIKSKSVTAVGGREKPIPLPENFTPDQVPDSAKETCRNWFYKVASIRELLPRLYVEMAILKCYRFLTTGEYSRALLRLTKQIKGIGNPLVASYARTYLCRVGIDVAAMVKDHLNPCLFDFLFSYGQLMSDNVQNSLAKQAIDMTTYLQLYPPSLEWVLQCIAYKVSEETLSEILEKCQLCNSALILNSLMSTFDPNFIAARALEFSSLIKECKDLGFPKFHLYKSLGCCLIVANPPEDQRLPLLNEVWKVVTKLKDPNEYIKCAEIWIEFPLKHFTAREVNTFIADITKHMTPDRAFENSYPQLLAILSKTVSYIQDCNDLFSMEKFLPFMDMFQKESVKVDASKTIMEAFNRYQKEQLSDPVIINALMQICKTMHDSVNSLSLQDEKRIIGNLICGFLQTVEFGRDFEQQLNFFVEARANFSNLDSVLLALVQRVNALAMRTREIVKGNHTRKTAAFVRACMANCFITIPSMMDVFTRLKLYLLSGEVALANQAIGQADAFFRTAINLIADVPKTIEVEHKMRSSEPYLVECINNLLSASLVVPDHPEHGTLYLIRGLLNVIQEYNWEQNSDSRPRIYLNAITVLSAYCQEKYAYGIHKVDSNDKLYGSDKKFIGEIIKIIDTLTNEVLEELKLLDEKNLKVQGFLLLAHINRIIISADLASPVMLKLVQNLWKKAQENSQTDAKLMSRMWKYVSTRAQEETHLQELADFMARIAKY